MDQNEIKFWQEQVESGQLMVLLRIERSRSERFFGKAAVSRGDEAELFRIVEAYSIVDMSSENLLAKMNRAPDLLAEQLDKVSPPTFRKVVEKFSRFTAKDVAEMKNEANAYLRQLIR
ncbi:MAG TPA: hypothetical protein VGI03_00330 [Verrucomicrobiae bacterium]|jgi:hypothetical protein